ncbi:hypothetical protein P7C71_g5245, partial [Lecanoromycetidae sp. Uapishka_2]
MHAQLFTMASATLALLCTVVTAYPHNRKGFSNSPRLTDCQVALQNINTGQIYSDGAQFSVGSCYMVYATNGARAQTISGQIIYDIAQNILNDCGHYRGSFGTNNVAVAMSPSSIAPNGSLAADAAEREES